MVVIAVNLYVAADGGNLHIGCIGFNVDIAAGGGECAAIQRGAIIYLNQEGRGIGLFNKINAYKLQEEGLDTVDANLHLGFGVDERDYGVGASIIRELGIKHMRLMTNNPLKRAGLEGYGLRIDEIVPIVIEPNPYNERYLETKQNRMHHKLGLCKH